MDEHEARYRQRPSAPIRNKSFWWTALALSLLLSAVLLGAGFEDALVLPVKAVRWFLGLDEADKFAIPIHPIESGVNR